MQVKDEDNESLQALARYNRLNNRDWGLGPRDSLTVNTGPFVRFIFTKL